MKFLANIFLFATLLTGLLSCGADKLKTKISSGQSNLAAGQGCNCISNHSPVCGDAKDYDNSCIAQCFGANTITAGHCDCSTNLIPVCGRDGKNHTECEAKSANIEIVQFIPCGTTEI